MKEEEPRRIRADCVELSWAVKRSMGPHVPIDDTSTDAQRRETIARLAEGTMVLELRLSAE